MESPLSGRDATGRLPHFFILPCRPSAKLPLGGTLAEGGKGAMSPFPPPKQLSSDIFNRASGTSRALKFLSRQRQCDSSILIFPYSLYHWESKYSGSWCVRPVMYLYTPPITGSPRARAPRGARAGARTRTRAHACARALVLCSWLPRAIQRTACVEQIRCR